MAETGSGRMQPLAPRDPVFSFTTGDMVPRQFHSLVTAWHIQTWSPLCERGLGLGDFASTPSNITHGRGAPHPAGPRTEPRCLTQFVWIFLLCR